MSALNYVKNYFESLLLKPVGYDRAIPMQLDITNACNLSCKHCYHLNHKNDGALSPAQIEELIVEYFQLSNFLGFKTEILFCGGEPLLNKNIKNFIERARGIDPNVTIWILTNGLLLNHDWLEFFQNAGNVHLQISLDGHNSETHDWFRGKNSFERVITKIKLAKTYNTPIHLLATLSKINQPYIEGFFKLAKELNADSMSFTRLIETGTALNNSKSVQTLLPLELKKAYTSILCLAGQYEVSTSVNLPLMRLIHPLLGSNGRFADGITIDYQGNYLASSRSRLKIGNIRNMSMRAMLLNHPSNKALRKGEIEGCGACKFFDRCGGDRNVAYAASGNFFSKDPGCWLGITDETKTKKEKEENETIYS